MLRPATIIVPQYFNDGSPVMPHIHDDLARKIVSLSGGLTITMGTGMWVSPEGEEMVDENYVFTFALPSNLEDRVPMRDAVRSIAEWAAEVYDQQAVYIDTPYGGIEFISRKGAAAKEEAVTHAAA